MTSQTHVAGGALFTTAGLGAANAAGWMHTPAWALAIGIAWEPSREIFPTSTIARRVFPGPGWRCVAGRLLGVPARIVGVLIRGLRVTHRGPTHSLTFLALWAAIAAPLYAAFGGVLLVALAWVAGKLAAVSHTGAHVNPQSAVRFLLAHLAVVYPYAVLATALGYVSHLVLTRSPVRSRGGGRSHTGASRSRPRLSGSALPPRSKPGWSGRRFTIAAVLAILEVAGIPSHPW